MVITMPITLPDVIPASRENAGRHSQRVENSATVYSLCPAWNGKDSFGEVDFGKPASYSAFP